MGKSMKNPKPEGLCRRIFRALKGQTKHPKLVTKEYRPNDNVNISPWTGTAQVGSGEGSDEGQDNNTNVKVGRAEKKKKKKHDDEANDDNFSNFIDRAKMKIRTVSNVGGVAKTPARTDSINDKALDYINRAKVRIRTTSMNLGNGLKGLASK